MAPPRNPNPTPKILRNRRYRERHPTRIQARNRRDNLWRQYRITIDDYDKQNYEQGGVCIICGFADLRKDGTPSGRRLDVDHCHDCMEFRSLLCRKCNQAIGFFREDPDLIRRAADYVESHKDGERHTAWLEANREAAIA